MKTQTNYICMLRITGEFDEIAVPP